MKFHCILKNFKYNKIHLERNPFQFSNMAERLPFKNYSQIKSKEMDKRIAGVCLYLRL